MPRAQVYITQNNYKRIQSIVDAKKEDGADRTEANVSSVAAMLLDIGLRVYEFQQKEEQEGEIGKPEDNKNFSDMINFNKILLENILKASYASTTLLQMIGELEEIKNINVFSYDNVRAQIRDKVDDQLTKIFNDDCSVK
ncbi:TPA: relaxosome protein TraM [Yersinia enterocolitica]|nr:relaxosome protein TraM [Yersinia enterocolitica]